MSFVQDAKKIEEIVNQIRPHLANQDPGVVGAVLAELLAMLCAGMFTQDPDFIEQMLDAHIKCVKDLIPIERVALVARMSPELRKKMEEHLDIAPKPGYLHS